MLMHAHVCSLSCNLAHACAGRPEAAGPGQRSRRCCECQQRANWVLFRMASFAAAAAAECSLRGEAGQASPPHWGRPGGVGCASAGTGALSLSQSPSTMEGAAATGCIARGPWFCPVIKAYHTHPLPPLLQQLSTQCLTSTTQQLRTALTPPPPPHVVSVEWGLHPCTAHCTTHSPLSEHKPDQCPSHSGGRGHRSGPLRLP